MITAIILAASCTAIDGDTLRCGAERYRLLGIDAPELPGHCRIGRDCAPGDPVASKAALASLVDGKQVRLEVVGKDRYGRGLALASVGGVDLSCAQVKAGRAVYVAKWDDGRRLSDRCSGIAIGTSH